MLSPKLLSCLAVMSAIVMASCEAHAEVAEPDEGSKLLTSPSSAISQHDTTRSLRTADAAVVKANEERGDISTLLEAVEKKPPLTPGLFRDILKSAGHDRIDTAHQEYTNLYDQLQELHQKKRNFQQKENELRNEAQRIRLALKKEGPDGNINSGLHAAVFGDKFSTNWKAKRLKDQLVPIELSIAFNQAQHPNLEAPIDTTIRELEDLLRNRVSKLLKEGLVGDVDKGKAAGGAHAGTDHGAV